MKEIDENNKVIEEVKNNQEKEGKPNSKTNKESIWKDFGFYEENDNGDVRIKDSLKVFYVGGGVDWSTFWRIPLESDVKEKTKYRGGEGIGYAFNRKTY